MKNRQIEIKVNGFRAIASADIGVNGITVVAGDNGSGKSTLSKLLYHTFRISNDFDSLVKARLFNNSSLDKSLKAMYEISEELRWFSKVSKKDIEIGVFELVGSEHQSLVDIKTGLNQYVEALANLAVELLSEPIEHRDYKKRLDRLSNIIHAVTDGKQKDNEDLPSRIKDLQQLMNRLFDEAIKDLESRTLDIWNAELRKEFPEGSLTQHVKIFEFGVLINDSTAKKLLDTQSIHEVAYIDTPFMLDMMGRQAMFLSYRYNAYRSSSNAWSDLLKKIIVRKENAELKSSIDFSSVLQGEAYYNNEPLSRGFKYKRKDGKEFNLLDCATGIKSLSILQMLSANGYLDNNTLLIIDEPEAHMHPQWIVEYARLIVLLNKQFGVKFFIASHNPDFVSAIRYISESEGTMDDLNLYIAKRDSSSFNYTFKALGTEIGEIFESFNIALDRIELYGKSC